MVDEGRGLRDDADRLELAGNAGSELEGVEHGRSHLVREPETHESVFAGRDVPEHLLLGDVGAVGAHDDVECLEQWLAIQRNVETGKLFVAHIRCEDTKKSRIS